MNYETIKKLTHDKFESLDFSVGDVFSEMLSHWEVIIKVDNEMLTILYGTSSILKMKTLTKSDFTHICSYKSISGYWLDYIKNDIRYVDGFLKKYIEQEKMSKEKIRDFKLNLII